MEVLASRDITYGLEWITQLREILETTPFHCKILLTPQPRVGLLRIEYMGHSEQEVRDCDLKLTAKIITSLEARGRGSPVIFPLEVVSPWFSGSEGREPA